MKRTDLKNQQELPCERFSEYEQAALYLSVPFLLCIGIMPWIAY